MPYKDPERAKEYRRQYYKDRPVLVENMTAEQLARTRENARLRRNRYQAEWIAKSGGQGYRSPLWAQHIKIKYGLSVAQFDALLKSQNNCCAACKAPFKGLGGSRSDRLAVDHCHYTNRVRGMLCGACNRTIGHAKENIRRLLACADYLLAQL